MKNKNLKTNIETNIETTKEKTCENEAAFRYTWAGQVESFVCSAHANQLKTIANAIGYYIQLIPIEQNQGVFCCQIIK